MFKVGVLKKYFCATRLEINVCLHMWPVSSIRSSGFDCCRMERRRLRSVLIIITDRDCSGGGGQVLRGGGWASSRGRCNGRVVFFFPRVERRFY
jgi:hypothetical protein